MNNCELDRLMAAFKKWSWNDDCGWYENSDADLVALGCEWHPSTDNAQAIECLEAWKAGGEGRFYEILGYEEITVALFPDDVQIINSAGNDFATVICTALAEAVADAT